MQDYMEDYEVYIPFQSLEALGCHVDDVCPNKHDFKQKAHLKDTDASSYDALVIPGRWAPEYLVLFPAVIKLVKDFMEAERP